MGPNGRAQDEDGGSRAGPCGAPVGYSLGDAAWTAGRGRSLPESGHEELKGGGVGMGSVRRPGSGAGVPRRPGGPKAVGFQIYGRNFTVYVATLVGLGLVRESC